MTNAEALEKTKSKFQEDVLRILLKGGAVMSNARRLEVSEEISDLVLTRLLSSKQGRELLDEEEG